MSSVHITLNGHSRGRFQVSEGGGGVAVDRVRLSGLSQGNSRDQHVEACPGVVC